MFVVAVFEVVVVVIFLVVVVVLLDVVDVEVIVDFHVPELEAVELKVKEN